jgi:hypothetical protein
MSKCDAKHTLYQPTDKEWRCPKCGADSEKFYIYESASNDDSCSKLHCDDDVRCFACDSEWTGSRIASIMKKKANMDIVKCKCCNGTGYIAIPKKEKKS